MLTLLLSSLLITGLYVNGSNEYQALESHQDEGGQVLYYDYQSYASDIVLRDGDNNFSFVTNNGTLEFNIVNNRNYVAPYTTWDLQFKVVNVNTLSNIYLYNLTAYYSSASGVEHEAALQNVYFMGQPNYYDDNESGNYTLFSEGNYQPYIYLDFNIGLLPKEFVDGSGYQQGYNDGFNSGYSTGIDEGLGQGYQTGYSDGYSDASDSSSTAVTIFTGICEVGLLPINVFLGILNFEVFGINIGGFVASLLTIAIVVIVLRVVLGGKGKDD